MNVYHLPVEKATMNSLCCCTMLLHYDDALSLSRPVPRPPTRCARRRSTVSDRPQARETRPAVLIRVARSHALRHLHPRGLRLQSLITDLRAGQVFLRRSMRVGRVREGLVALANFLVRRCRPRVGAAGQAASACSAAEFTVFQALRRGVVF